MTDNDTPSTFPWLHLPDHMSQSFTKYAIDIAGFALEGSQSRVHPKFSRKEIPGLTFLVSKP
jgi:hypothetical protein